MCHVEPGKFTGSFGINGAMQGDEVCLSWQYSVASSSSSDGLGNNGVFGWMDGVACSHSIKSIAFLSYECPHWTQSGLLLLG